MSERLAVVTGGAGFIGRHLVGQLRARGDRVRVLDIDTSGARFDPRVEVICGSILDIDAVEAALRGATHLYHLAGNPNLWARHKRDFVEVNTHGTRIVLDRAADAGLERIVVTSTETVLAGWRGSDPVVVSESAAEPALRDMAGAYCQSKLMADRISRAAARRGLPVVLVHPTIPIGAGDVHLTPPTRMIQGFLNRGFPAYLECQLNLIAVEDVAAGHILAAERGRIGESYILGNTDIRMSRLLEMLQQISGRPMPHYRFPYWAAYGFSAVAELVADHVLHAPPVAPLTGVRLARASRSFECSKAHRELGLERSSVRGALERAVAWLSTRGLLRQPVPGVPRVRVPGIRPRGEVTRRDLRKTGTDARGSDPGSERRRAS